MSPEREFCYWVIALGMVFLAIMMGFQWGYQAGQGDLLRPLEKETTR